MAQRTSNVLPVIPGVFSITSLYISVALLSTSDEWLSQIFAGLNVLAAFFAGYATIYVARTNQKTRRIPKAPRSRTRTDRHSRRRNRIRSTGVPDSHPE